MTEEPTRASEPAALASARRSYPVVVNVPRVPGASCRVPHALWAWGTELLRRPGNVEHRRSERSEQSRWMLGKVLLGHVRACGSWCLIIPRRRPQPTQGVHTWRLVDATSFEVVRPGRRNRGERAHVVGVTVSVSCGHPGPATSDTTVRPAPVSAGAGSVRPCDAVPPWTRES